VRLFFRTKHGSPRCLAVAAVADLVFDAVVLRGAVSAAADLSLHIAAAIRIVRSERRADRSTMAPCRARRARRAYGALRRYRALLCAASVAVSSLHIAAAIRIVRSERRADGIRYTIILDA